MMPGGRYVPAVNFPQAILAIFVTCAGSVAAEDESAGDSAPNIVFIYTDDQAPTALGAAGNTQIHTPCIDRLFREGARLDNAFVTTPVCSPSRASLMTSRYASELGIFDYIDPRLEHDHGLDPETLTWPEVLAANGYRTGLVGKWHLGTADRFHPTCNGYDYFMGIRAGGTTPRDPLLEIDGDQRKFEGLTVDIFTDQAIDFVRRNQGERFLLSLHYRAPHAPWLPVRDEDWAPYADLDPLIPNPDYPLLDIAKIKRMSREYMASVSGVDRNVGRLLDTIDELGLRDRTVVIFTSDHGYNLGHNGVWYKGNAQWQLTTLPEQRWPGIPALQRPNLFDQSLRVPAAVRWPGVIPPGTVVDPTVTNLDWYPTLLAMAGVEVPPTVTVRGRNMLPLLRGESLDWDDDLYAEYSMKHGASTHMRMLRTPTWKLMIDYQNQGRAELYDLVSDPHETRNLVAAEDPAVAAAIARLRGKIHDRMRQLNDPALALISAAP